MASFVRLSHLSGRSSNVGNVHSNASDTVPTMEIGDETVADAKHLINSKINSNKFCVAVDGSDNSWIALGFVLNTFCNSNGGGGALSLEVVHVPELNLAEMSFDIQPDYIKKEAMKELDQWNLSNPEIATCAISYVEAVRFKKGQSVRGTLAYHINEIARPRFLVTGLIGAGTAANHIGGFCDEPGTTMAHNIRCSHCTSIVVSPDAEKLLDVTERSKPKKYVIAVDGSGRSFQAFQDVCALCDNDIDSIVVFHVLMSNWKDTKKAAKAAKSIENFYCQILPLLGMKDRVSYKCVKVDCESEEHRYLTIGQSIASFAEQEMATFLAVGVDGAAVWHDITLQWKAQQCPSPGRVVRHLTLLQNAPCSLIVSCTSL